MIVRFGLGLRDLAMVLLRCAVAVGIALHAVLPWSAAVLAKILRLTARFGLGLGAVAMFLLRRATGAGTALSGLAVALGTALFGLAVVLGMALAGLAVRLAAAVTVAAVRLAVTLRGLAAWLRRGLAGVGPARSRTLAFGLSAAALVFVMLAVPWVHDFGPSMEGPPVTAAIPDGEDMESEIAALDMPPRGTVIEPAPVPDRPVVGANAPVPSDLPNEDLVTAPFRAAEPPRETGSRDLALLPERPRARPRRGRPQWLANAVETDLQGAGPLIAIVIDDVGIAQKRTARTIDLPAPLTLAFIPYGDNLEGHTRHARGRGHELIVHVPMEPSSAAVDPGPNALLTGLGEDEIMRRFVWGLSRFDGYVGVSNHMGSRFMARSDLLEPLLAVTQERGLLFLDSRTTAETAGTGIARRLRLPNAHRDVFLDNEISVANVTAQLAEVERIARRQGHAVAIGHPHDVTVDVLAKWIPEARARGFTLVPVSTIVRLEYGAEYEDRLAAAISAGGEAEGLLGRPQ